MPQLTNNNQSSQGIELGNPLDIMKALTSAFGQPKEQTDAANNLSIQDNQQKIINQLMADVAKKKITEDLNKHADNLIATNPDAHNILAGIIAAGDINNSSANAGATNSNNSTSSSSATSAPSNAMPGNDAANNTNPYNSVPIIKPAKGFFGGARVNPDGSISNEGVGNQILRMLTGISGPSVNQVLDRTEQAQKIALENPARIDLMRAQTSESLQKQAGQEPLQVGEREKIKLETIKELQKISATAQAKGLEALTPENATKFNLLIDGGKAVKEVASFLQESPGVLWSAPSFLASQKGRQYESAVKRMVRNKLRLESGAAISDKEVDEEYKKYKVGKTDSKETIRRKLSPLHEFYQGSLNVADPQGVQRQRASGKSSFKVTQIGD